MKVKKTFILMIMFLTFSSYNYGQISISDINELFGTLTGAMSDMEVFANMDKNIKKLQELAEAAEKMEKPLEYAERAQKIHSIVTRYEKMLCGMQDYNNLHQQYLNSDWYKLMGENGSCLTGLDHETFVENVMGAHASIKNITEYIDKQTFTAAEIEELQAKAREEFQSNIDLLNEKIEDMKPKIEWNRNLEAYQAGIVQPYELDLGKYDPMKGEGSKDFQREFASDGKGIIWTIIKLVLLISLVPAVISLTQGDYKLLFGWGVAFFIFVIAQNLF